MRADSDATDHEADLVDHAVAQHAAQVVFDHSVKDREAGHDHANVYQQLGTRKAPRQRIHGDLGGHGTE